MNIVGLRELIGQAMLLSFAMLFIAYIICGIAETIKKEIKRRNTIKCKLKAKKTEKIKQMQKEKNELRLAHIRQCQGII